jgi:hypothetical protein
MAEEESGGTFEGFIFMSFVDKDQQEERPGLLRTPARRHRVEEGRYDQ